MMATGMGRGGREARKRGEERRREDKEEERAAYACVGAT